MSIVTIHSLACVSARTSVHMNNTSSEVKPYTRKRKIDQVAADVNEIATPLLSTSTNAANNSNEVTNTALSIREKLKSKGMVFKIALSELLISCVRT